MEKQTTRCLTVGLVSVLIWLATTESAFAYIDPGAGSLSAQVLMGGVAGAAAIIRLYWRTIISRFLRRNRSDEISGQDAD
jgi:hypothetical protein